MKKIWTQYWPIAQDTGRYMIRKPAARTVQPLEVKTQLGIMRI